MLYDGVCLTQADHGRSRSVGTTMGGTMKTNSEFQDEGAAKFAPPVSAFSSVVPTALLSIDVEDWAQLVAEEIGHPNSDIPRPAMVRQMNNLFGLLDRIGARATFFALTKTAKNYPEVMREIVDRGHEVACHGHAHRRIFTQTADEFRTDVAHSMEVIQGLTGKVPIGYRAPAFSITRDSSWALEILVALGLRYDASLHDTPRIPARLLGIPGRPFRIELPSGQSIWEFPPTVFRANRMRLPIGGGSYWRVMPHILLRALLRQATRSSPYLSLYFHPYECDPEPLRAPPFPGSTLKQWATARAQELRYRPGRKRLVAGLPDLLKTYRMVTYAQAMEEISREAVPCSRTLSPTGVLV